MAAGNLDITIEQGSTFTRTIAVQDSALSPVNLSSVTAVRGQIRRTYNSTESYAFTLAVVSAPAGTISWAMSAVVSASIPVVNQQPWVYDIELVRGTSVERLLQGAATISPEVTR